MERRRSVFAFGDGLVTYNAPACVWLWGVVHLCSSWTGAVVRCSNCQCHGRGRTDGRTAVFCRLSWQIQGTSSLTLAVADRMTVMASS